MRFKGSKFDIDFDEVSGTLNSYEPVSADVCNDGGSGGGFWAFLKLAAALFLGAYVIRQFNMLGASTASVARVRLPFWQTGLGQFLIGTGVVVLGLVLLILLGWQIYLMAKQGKNFWAFRVASVAFRAVAVVALFFWRLMVSGYQSTSVIIRRASIKLKRQPVSHQSASGQDQSTTNHDGVLIDQRLAEIATMLRDENVTNQKPINLPEWSIKAVKGPINQN
jgi:hypothetical protein